MPERAWPLGKRLKHVGGYDVGLAAPFRLWILALASGWLPSVDGLHHMKARSIPIRRDSGNDTSVPMVIRNQCAEDIYPGVATQGGVGPKSSGFKLAPGLWQNLTVSPDWQGRIWGRTNCSFNENGTGPANEGGIGGSGRACLTGDCYGVINCTAAGATPVTLAEFTLDGNDGQTYYDISLVDGYNLPMAIIMLPRRNKVLEDIPPNLTNPSCQGTADLLAPSDYNPYSTLESSQTFLGTNNSFPLPFVGASLSTHHVSRWCPWELQVNPPAKPGDGVYPYPDDKIQRPAFNPCFSACAKWNKPSDCCTGKHNAPNKCGPSFYSKAAKTVCPDAYSYAYDDHKSTFITPIGAGFEIVFCPGGRSTDILSHRPAVDKAMKENPHLTSLNITALPNRGSRGCQIGSKASSVAAFAIAILLAVS